MTVIFQEVLQRFAGEFEIVSFQIGSLFREENRIGMLQTCGRI